jgi:hypothetical protein
VIRAKLDAVGCVVDASILKGGSTPALAALALNKVLAAQFLPARPEPDCSPVEMTWTRLVEYW